ncbi:unnamed protein product [Paramecium pentaurelia]|uniref:Uncharacterized protein n=1 Tax=Paramecium pentaurelia TaxID=43138 RepID=A0A8S1YQQ3_9CILI|nr:unnamed protein product [Paramecium pentaurelia]
MNSEQIVSQLENKIQERLQGVQQQLDSSFNRIEAFLDQIPPPPYPPVPQNNVNFVLPVIQISQPLILTLANQVIQEIKPLINLTIHNQIKQTQPQQIQQQKIEQPIIINNPQQFNLMPFTYFYQRINQLDKLNIIIKVFEFKLEKLKKTQRLSYHPSDVTTLNFIQKQNQFISGSGNGQIIIWSMNENSQWACQQKLNNHSNFINYLIINNNEDVMISGSDDKTIKF